ncbi:hypothetical protein SNE40_005753 [Patella caerulea]|uniref:Uncharacterized protein n=1 Tax=Patella caerulea TaxID=87958 RepID=A0AAN8PWW2_PATCE
MSAGYVSVTKSSQFNEFDNDQVDNIQFYRPKEVGPFRLKNTYNNLRQKPWFLFVAVGLAILFLVIVISVIALSVHESSPAPKAPQYDKYMSRENGLQFYPIPMDETVLIKFRPMIYNSYRHYNSFLNGYLSDYHAMHQINNSVYTRCSKDYAPGDKVCRFTLADLGDQCTTHKEYGYHAGNPCILFVLKMPAHVKPAPFTKDEVKFTLGDRWSPDHIGISCEGTTDADRSLIGSKYVGDIDPIQYFPKEGFPTYFYRNLTGATDFLHPLVMIKFNTIPDFHYIQITCRAWVKNIDIDQTDDYSTTFAVYKH